MNDSLTQVLADYKGAVNCDCSTCQKITAKVVTFIKRAFVAGQNNLP